MGVAGPVCHWLCCRLRACVKARGGHFEHKLWINCCSLDCIPRLKHFWLKFLTQGHEWLQLHVCMFVMCCYITSVVALSWSSQFSSYHFMCCVFNLQLQGCNCGKFYLTRFWFNSDIPQNKGGVFSWTQCNNSNMFITMWSVIHTVSYFTDSACL